jgi:WD40 repeat protein
LLASASETKICVWDISNKSTPFYEFLDAHTDSINDVKFSPLDENLLISTADDGNFKLWDLR